MSRTYAPWRAGEFIRLCGSCGTIMARDIIRGRCWCLNSACAQYKEKWAI